MHLQSNECKIHLDVYGCLVVIFRCLTFTMQQQLQFFVIVINLWSLSKVFVFIDQQFSFFPCQNRIGLHNI